MKKILGVGIATIDIVNIVEKFPDENSEIRASAQRICRGGNVTNSLSVLSQLGQNCYWCGVISDENNSRIITDDLEKNKVDSSLCHHIYGGKMPTSYITLNESNGTRSIIHYRDIPELTFTHFKKIDISQFDWIHFEARAIHDTVRMLSYVQEKFPHITLSVEIEKNRQYLTQILGIADLYLFSRNFALSSHQNAESFLQDQKQLSPNADLICAWGEEGAYALTRDNQLIKSPAFPPVKIIDTLGAGDTFNAGIIYTRIKEINWTDSLQFACQLAGLKCGQHGFSGLVTKNAEAHDFIVIP